MLDQFLLYGETTTSIVNATPVPRRDPPPRRDPLPRAGCPTDVHSPCRTLDDPRVAALASARSLRRGGIRAGASAS